MKYDRSKIMKRAWYLKKTLHIELGQAISMSWDIEKKELKEIEEAKKAVNTHTTTITYKEVVEGLGFNYRLNKVA